MPRVLSQDLRERVIAAIDGGMSCRAAAARFAAVAASGCARPHDGRTVYRANMIATLQRRELLRVAGQLSDELGLAFAETRPGDHVEGTLGRMVEMTSGRYALIERSREFTLVPWRPVLERQVGKPVAGIVRGDGVSWTFGRQRSGPSIS